MKLFPFHRPHFFKKPLQGVMGVLLSAGLLVSNVTYANADMERLSLSLPTSAMNVAKETDSPHNTNTLTKRQFTIGRNQTLSHAIDGVNNAPGMAFQIARLENAAFFTQLRVGDTLDIWTDADNNLQRIDLQKTRLLSYHLTRENDTFTISSQEKPVETRIQIIQATIDDSLYLSAKAAGLSSRTIMNLADIFAWEIDYIRELRTGNELKLIYEQRFLNNEYLEDGKIIAAEMTVGQRPRTVRAIRYENQGELIGYFDENGDNLRKAFMRNPINYTRISSRFQKGRYHPVLQEIRDHKGVDYAAPTGTPIYAAGDGTIKFRGWGNGYGNYIIIQHAGRYETVYGHMSRFGKFRQGQTVKQGEVIGYVGMTGLATGPHLHYEFRIDGVHHDPLTVKFPNAEPIQADLRDDFLQHASLMVAQFERNSDDTTKLAMRFE
ncbi:peptidoglycan DD-metalloendopeptidase family protein [Thiomicrospira microaerophila]|uniref:peptidoglycan DD-metalloendopeptidase family protein n=1 Tax=Thiomicrospira microaerophila TaxID=406020 RepID=UPI00069807B2|nr:peptidoglycan DD-metalloendopeptidase family protein [Thiomicrospira microaerophila]